MASNDPDKLIGLHALSYYLKRITTFLESNKKTLSFPRIDSELQKVLIKIVTENAEFLTGNEYSVDVRQEAENVLSAMKKCTQNTLKYEIKDGKHGSNVLSYFKCEEKCKTEIEPPKPLRPPSVKTPTLVVTPDDGLSSNFKTQCLNAATKFVKDDTQMVMTFPEMTYEQARFVVNMLLPGIKGETNSDVGLGFRSMYASLWECMHMSSSKYEYKIENDCTKVSKEELKCLIFKKIPKEMKSVKEENVIDTSPKTNYISSESEDVKSNITTSTPKKSAVIIRLIKHISKRMETGVLTPEFVHDACKKISEFMMDDEKKEIVFSDVAPYQMLFIEKLRTLSCTTSSYMLFTSQCQKYMDNIRYCYNVKKVRYIAKKIRNNSIILIKDEKEKENLCAQTAPADAKEIILASNVDKAISTTNNSENNIATDVNIKSEDMKNQGTTEMKPHLRTTMTKLRPLIRNEQTFIYESLERILDYLYDEQQASLMFQKPSREQVFFIQNIPVLVLNECTHSVFDEPAQKLLKELNSIFSAIRVPWSLTKFKRFDDYKIEKPANFSIKPLTKKLINENDNVLKHAQQSETEKVTKPIQDESLMRLTGIIDDMLKYSGEQILYFLNDIANFLTLTNKDKCLTFDDVTYTEAIFLKHVRMASKNEAVYSMFSHVCAKLLRNIKVNAESYKLTFKMYPDDKNEGSWTVVLGKQAASLNQPKAAVQHKSRSLSEDRKSSQKSNLKLDCSPRANSSQRSHKGKEVLKEALAKPVQCDKALRMMANMGWDGGALGTRGEGLTEPISLCLDLVSRAGLGHVPPPKKAKKKKKKLRLNDSETTSSVTSEPTQRSSDKMPIKKVNARAQVQDVREVVKTVTASKDYIRVVLNGIYEMITTDAHAVNIVPAGLKLKKINGFVNHAVKLFNRGIKLNLDDDTLFKTVRDIELIFWQYPGLTLVSTVIDQRIIVIEKQMINNNGDLIQNKNLTRQEVATKSKSSVAHSLLINDLDARDVTNKNDAQQDKTENVCSVIDKTVIAEKRSPIIHKVTPMIKDEDTTQFVTEDNKKNVEIKKTSNMQKDTLNNVDLIENMTETLYIIPISYNETIDNSVEQIIGEEPKNKNPKISNVDLEDSVLYKDIIQDLESLNLEHNVKIVDDVFKAKIKESKTFNRCPKADDSKCLSDLKIVCIRPKDYRQTTINTNKAREIQAAILKAIAVSQKPLPILKSHGIQNGGLVYTCQGEKSLLFLEDLIKSTDYELDYGSKANNSATYKMAFKISSYVDELMSSLLNSLELYNSNLKTENWIVVKKDRNEEISNIVVEMDKKSFDYVCDNNFVLCAGTDIATFTILWE